ncbi:MAG: DUF1559 domain-containing protein [Capsulimonas sp.]|uniref:DUF1559 family PulG-like putative transporter n=1 Tax=Capsulimonas sp. TaxID=2494211 RepID=UPI0032645471
MIGRSNFIGGACIAVALTIFALILFPLLFRPVIRREPRLTCASNLRQLGLALLQYAQDNDENLPPRQNASGANGSLVSWRYLIFPYAKSRSLYQCPSHPGAPSTSESTPLTVDDLGASYAVNATHDDKKCFGPFADKYHRGFSLSDAPSPAQTIALVESTAAFNDFNPLFPEGFAQPSNARTRVGNLFSGHNQTSSVLFLDGHFQQIKPAQMLDQTGPNPWTTDGAPFTAGDRTKAMNTIQYSERTYAQVKEEAPREYMFLWNAGRGRL